jgi:hypothetical protein
VSIRPAAVLCYYLLLLIWTMNYVAWPTVAMLSMCARALSPKKRSSLFF